MKDFLVTWKELALPVGILGATVVLALAAHYLFFKMVDRLAKSSKRVLDDTLVRHCRAPARIIIPVLAVYFVLPLIRLSQAILVFL